MGRSERGQATLEYILIYSGLMVPVVFALIFTAQLLWVWHSVIELARDGAHYATTHCWQASGDNVRDYMRQHAPIMVDREQIVNAGEDVLSIQYYSRDPDTGGLVDFSCETGECSTQCVPELVTVRIQNYEFRHAFLTFLGLPPVQIPDFRTSLSMESAGCDPEQGECFP